MHKCVSGYTHHNFRLPIYPSPCHTSLAMYITVLLHLAIYIVIYLDIHITIIYLVIRPVARVGYEKTDEATRLPHAGYGPGYAHHYVYLTIYITIIYHYTP